TEEIPQLCIRVERQWVLALRAVERHYADVPLQPPLEVSRRIGIRIELRLCLHCDLAHAPSRPARCSLSSPRRSINCFLWRGGTAPKRSTTQRSCSAAMRRN